MQEAVSDNYLNKESGQENCSNNFQKRNTFREFGKDITYSLLADTFQQENKSKVQLI
jgi:hypothetical protein